MMKQAGGFTLMGAVVSTLGAALGRPGEGWAYVSGTSFSGEFVGRWGSQFISATVGAAVGFLIGVVLHVAGLRVVSVEGNRVGRVVTAGVVGVCVGLSPALYYVGSAVVGLPMNVSVAWPTDTLLALYAISAALGYVCAVGAVLLTLRASKDHLATRTTKAVALALPIGGVAATVAGVGAAWFLGFTTSVSTLVAVVLTVVLLLAATFALARGRVVSRETGPR